MASSKMGQPVQIIDLEMNPNGLSRMKLEQTNLKYILDTIANKKVALISIAGPSRQGKSFLLSYMIRYLGAMEEENTRNWMSKSDKSDPLVGFAFKNGIERQTVGIWIWSKPFIIKNEEGEEIAVLVMDTQGVFDEFTSNREWSAIVGLCLLTSSCLIYNVVNNLQEDVLQTLETFMQYGILSMKDDETGDKCFQKLIFLIRDWSKPDDCDYGPLGGQKFLEHKLTIQPKMAESSVRVRRTLKKCFEDIHCYLMPDPGDDAKSNDFKGSLQEMTEGFADGIKTFMETFLSVDHLIPKKIGGTFIRANELVAHFKQYVNFFNRTDNPSPMSILDATAHASWDALAAKCAQAFQTNVKSILSQQGFLIKDEWDTMIKKQSELATRAYDDKRKFGSEKIVVQYKRLLQNELGKFSDSLKKENDSLLARKNDDEQERLLGTLKENISHRLANKFTLDKELQIILTEESKHAIKEFCSVFNVQGKDFLDQNINVLVAKIKTINAELTSANDEVIGKATAMMESLVNDSFDLYSDGIGLATVTSSNTSIVDDILLQFDNRFREKATRNFNSKVKVGSEEFIKHFAKKLDDRINQMFEDICKGNNDKRTELEVATVELIKEIACAYNAEITEHILQDTSSSEITLGQKHFELSQRYSGQFDNRCNIQIVAQLKPFKQQLADSLARYFEKAKILQIEKRSEIRERILDQVTELQHEYFDCMQQFINKDPLCSSEQLKEQHAELGKKLKEGMLFPEFFTTVEREKTKAELIMQIENRFESLQATYRKRLENADTKAEGIMSKLVDSYNKDLESKMKKVSQQSQLEDHNKTIRDKLNSNFRQQLSFLPQKRISMHLNLLDEELERCFESFLNTFRIHELELQQKAQQLLNESLLDYKTKIAPHIEKVQDENLLISWHDSIKVGCIAQTVDKAKELNLNWQELKEKFEKRLTDQFSSQIGIWRAGQDMVVDNADAIQEEILKKFTSSVERLFFEETIESEYLFQSKLSVLKDENLSSFYDNCPNLSHQLQRQKVSALKRDMEAITQNFHHRFLERKSQLQQEHVNQSVNAAVDMYRRSIDQLCSEMDYFESVALDGIHQDCKNNAKRTIPSDVTPVGVNDFEEAVATYFDSIKIRNENLLSAAKMEAEKQIEAAREQYKINIEHLSQNGQKTVTDADYARLKDDVWKACKENTKIPKKLLDEVVGSFDEILEKEKNEFALKMDKLEPSQRDLDITLKMAYDMYDNEMNQRIGKDEFVQPKELQAFHEKSIQIAFEAIKKNELKMTPTVQKSFADLFDTAFKKFEDINLMNLPDQPAIGIDLGTTFSCVAVYNAGKVTIIPNEYSKNTMPSYVAFKGDDIELVGEPAKNQAHENPANTIFDAKRLIGRRFDDEKVQSDMQLWPFTVVNESGTPKIKVNDKTYFPEEISAKILKKMKTVAEAYLGCPVENAVITVPAYFNDGQKQSTKDAGQIAGLKVLGILNEPTAAAIAYSLNYSKAETRNVLIFDFGGGTFDVAILTMQDGAVNVKGVDGDTHLGGEDFDNNLVDHCVAEFKKQHDIDLVADRWSTNVNVKNTINRKLRRIRNECEKRKCDLSAAVLATVALDALHDGKDMNVEITREKFESLNAALLTKTIEIVERALKAVNMTPFDIDDIVLVGGSTRIPKVQKLLTEFFNGKALNSKINPDEAVAFGAAIHAAVLNGKDAKLNKFQVIDVAPLSIGIEVKGGFMSSIIKRNTTIPIKTNKQYVTAEDNQEAVTIVIFEGEEPVAEKNHKLGSFELNGIPPGKAGSQKIDVTMEINKNGILNVTAQCKGAGPAKNLVIKPDTGRLSQETIEALMKKA